MQGANFKYIYHWIIISDAFMFGYIMLVLQLIKVGLFYCIYCWEACEFPPGSIQSYLN